MRRLAFVTVLLNSLATAAFAQSNQLSIFFNQSAGSVHTHHGYGAALIHLWTPRFSTGIAAAVEDPVVGICVGGILTPEKCTDIKVRTYPVDLTGRFHFLNDTRWKPYIGLGARYVGAPHLTSQQLLVVGHSYSDHVSAEFIGGLEFLFKPSFGLTAEVKGLLRNSEDYDSAFNFSGGLNWHF
jgi:outer membrane protein W